MSRAENERLTQTVAREVCQRTQGRALVVGSIAPLGSHYVIGLNAQDCVNGESLGQEEAEASRKEEVLKALDQATTKLREKLGETLPSVQKFDVPIEQVTTLSLDALKAYSMGSKLRVEKGDVEAIPMFKQAIESLARTGGKKRMSEKEQARYISDFMYSRAIKEKRHHKTIVSKGELPSKKA